MIVATNNRFTRARPNTGDASGNTLEFLDSERQNVAKSISEEQEEDAAKAVGMGTTFGGMSAAEAAPEGYGEKIVQKADNLDLPDAAKPVIREFGDGGMVRRFGRPFMGAAAATYAGSRLTKNLLGEEEIYEHPSKSRQVQPSLTRVQPSQPSGPEAPVKKASFEKEAVGKWLDDMASYFRSSNDVNLPDAGDAIEEYGRRVDSGEVDLDSLSPKEMESGVEDVKRNMQLDEAGKKVRNDSSFDESPWEASSSGSWTPDLKLRETAQAVGGAGIGTGAAVAGNYGYRSTQPEIKMGPQGRRVSRTAENVSHPAGPLRNGVPQRSRMQEGRRKQASVEKNAARPLSSLDRDGEKVKYQGRWMPVDEPVESWRPGKKRAVLASKEDGGEKKVRLVHYGSSRYDHNYSDKAKKNYLSRARGITNKDGVPTKDDPHSPNHWSIKDLWSEDRDADGEADFDLSEYIQMGEKTADGPVDKIKEKAESAADSASKEQMGAASALGLIGGKKSLDSAKPDVTGRETLYHGTTPDRAESIREEGLQPSEGEGPNIQALEEDRPDAYENSKGKTYTTPDKGSARMYGEQAVVGGPVEARQDPEAVMRSQIPGMGRGERVDMAIPTWKDEVREVPNPETRGDVDWFLSKMEEQDPFYDMPGKEQQYRAAFRELDSARVFDHEISPEYIKGSDDYKRLGAGEVLEYASKNPGRMGKGVGKAGLGLGLLGAGGYAAREAIQKHRSAGR